MRAQEDFHVGEQHWRERPNINNLAGTGVRKTHPLVLRDASWKDEPWSHTFVWTYAQYRWDRFQGYGDNNSWLVLIYENCRRNLGSRKWWIHQAAINEFAGSSQELWSRVSPAVKEETMGSASFTDIVDKMAFWFKLTFLGADNFGRADTEKRRKYSQVILNLRLNNMEKESIDQYSNYTTSTSFQSLCGDLTKFPNLWKRCSSTSTFQESPTMFGAECLL